MFPERDTLETGDNQLIWLEAAPERHTRLIYPSHASTDLACSRKWLGGTADMKQKI